MTRIPAANARQRFAEVVNQAAYGGKRFAVTKNGKIAVGIVPAADLKLLEQLEDLEDIREAEKIRARIKSGKEKLIPAAEVKRELARTDRKNAIRRKTRS